MEEKKELNEKDERPLLAEWEKPSVEELDINTVTLTGFIGSGTDNSFYS